MEPDHIRSVRDSSSSDLTPGSSSGEILYIMTAGENPNNDATEDNESAPAERPEPPPTLRAASPDAGMDSGEKPPHRRRRETNPSTSEPPAERPEPPPTLRASPDSESPTTREPKHRKRRRTNPSTSEPPAEKPEPPPARAASPDAGMDSSEKPPRRKRRRTNPSTSEPPAERPVPPPARETRTQRAESQGRPERNESPNTTTSNSTDSVSGTSPSDSGEEHPIRIEVSRDKSAIFAMKANGVSVEMRISKDKTITIRAKDTPPRKPQPTEAAKRRPRSQTPIPHASPSAERLNRTGPSILTGDREPKNEGSSTDIDGDSAHASEVRHERRSEHEPTDSEALDAGTAIDTPGQEPGIRVNPPAPREHRKRRRQHRTPTEESPRGDPPPTEPAQGPSPDASDRIERLMNQGIRPGPRPSTVDPTPLHLDARTLAVINTLAQMRQKVIQAHHHDIVDVTAAIGAAGRIHAITALMLLERIENELAGRAQLVRARQGPALLLCSVVDCFIGEGLGAMLAAAGARGIPMSGLQGELEDMEVKLTGVPEEHCCCGAWGAGLRRATRAATDTYIGEHSDMDSRTEDSASGIYDRIRMNGDTRTRLKRMLGTSTAEEDAIAHLIIIGDGGKETIVDRTMAANRPGAAATRSSGAAASVVEGAVRVAARNPAGKERDALTQIANLIHNTGEARTEAGTTPHEVDMAAIMQQLINDPRGGRDLIALKVEAATRSAQECTTCVRGTTVQTQSGHSRVLVNVNIAIPDTDVEESIRHLGRVIEEARRSVNNMFVGGTQQGAIMEALIETLAQANERALRHSNA